jgi:hypothetical protein
MTPPSVIARHDSAEAISVGAVEDRVEIAAHLSGARNDTPLPVFARSVAPKQSCKAGDCRIRLKRRATKREVPDKSGNYKNLG